MEGDEDEYQLEDLKVVAADYMLKVGMLNFKNAWDSMGPDCERVDEYGLGVRESLTEAVSAVINILGLQPCEEKYGWHWIRPPPESRKILASGDVEGKSGGRKIRVKSTNMKDRLLKDFKCEICLRVMSFSITTSCAHHFCNKCLLDAYDDQSFIRERTKGGRTLRAQKIVKKCPSCTIDISNFQQNPQVNRELMDLIDSLQQKMSKENADGVEDENNEKKNADEDNDLKENDDSEGESDKDDLMVKHAEDDIAAEELRSSENGDGKSVALKP